jgi:methionine--tRNA ligase beta chain
MDRVTFDQFKALEIRIGKILSAEKIEGADKLLKLEVDFGDEERQIVAGIALHYDPKDLIGQKLPFVTNLEPRKFKGVESQGMLMAIEGEKPVLLKPSEDVELGSRIV